MIFHCYELFLLPVVSVLYGISAAVQYWWGILFYELWCLLLLLFIISYSLIDAITDHSKIKTKHFCFSWVKVTSSLVSM